MTKSWIVPTSLAGRSLAIMIALLAGLYLVDSFAFAPMNRISSGKADLALAQKGFTRVQSLAADLERLQALSKSESSSTRSSAQALVAENAALAGAELQQIIRRHLSATQLRAGRMAVRAAAASERELPPTIGLDLTLTGNFNAVVRFIAILENSAPKIVITKLDIKPQLTGGARRIVDASQVEARFSLSVLYKEGEST